MRKDIKELILNTPRFEVFQLDPNTSGSHIHQPLILKENPGYESKLNSVKFSSTNLLRQENYSRYSIYTFSSPSN